MKLSLTFILIFGLMKISFGQEYYRNWTVQNDSKKENIALIIANNHYESGGKLIQPIPTAKKLEITLNEQGFDVMVGRDLDRVQMAKIINEFSKKYTSYKFAMIAYLGHGFEINGQNYLIPIDANPPSKEEVELEAINLDYILKKVSNPNIAKAIVLDACRNNPFAKNWSSSERSIINDGFIEVSAPRNAEVFFTIQKNKKVNDENPYMLYLMEELTQGGCLDDIIRNVSNKIQTYDPKQIPAKYGQILDVVCFGDIINPLIEPIKPKIKIYNGIIPENELTNWVELNSIFDLRNAAKKGNIVAQRRIGRIYNYGTGVERDYIEAEKWLTKAANQGDATAQNNLGYLYGEGNGVVKDLGKAFSWHKRAAEQGLALAQYNLGHMYDYGKGVDADNIKAIKWYRKAAKQGEAAAQNNLGWFYANGKGVELDIKEATKWYRKAANQGYAAAQNNLGMVYDENKNYQEAIKWYRKAALQGYSSAQHNLGLIYGLGNGVYKDYDEAVKWHKKAAEQGLAEAQDILGHMYENGYGVKKNIEDAKKWYTKACNNGFSNACKKI